MCASERGPEAEGSLRKWKDFNKTREYRLPATALLFIYGVSATASGAGVGDATNASRDGSGVGDRDRGRGRARHIRATVKGFI